VNRETEATRRFHAATKYVAVPDGAGGERFAMGTPPEVEDAIWEEDRSIEPFPYKVYETLDPVPIPRDFPATAMPALEAIARTGAEPRGEATPDLAALARIALLSNGILKRGGRRQSGEVVEYRTSGGTGARYHLELYFVCGAVPGLDAGVYHYSAQDHSLRRVRAGDHRSVLVEATGGEASVAAAPVVLVMTSTFWRNAWRYKARAYRHAFWDAGTTLANLLAVAAAAGLPTRLVLGYADAPVNGLLDLDGRREAAVALCAIGRTDRSAPPAPEVPPLNLPVRAVSSREVEFPAIGMMHEASALATGEEAAAWRADPLRRTPREPRGALVPLRPVPADRLPRMPIEEAILGRRSTRRYDTAEPVPFEAFSTLLDRSARGVAADWAAPGAPPLHDQYLIVNGVDGLEQGVYRLHPGREAVELVRRGDFRQRARRLAVDQAYAGDAHVNSYYLAGLDPVVGRYGNRGYRAAQLEAALYAGRLHLGAHPLGLGAVGSTSFDDEVVGFFAPGEEASYLFVVVFGTRRRRTP
jgi:SagB-type dehydrogenase family enzyme